MTATETFAGFSAAEWTAIGTVALTVVTIVYVVITWRISKSAAALPPNITNASCVMFFTPARSWLTMKLVPSAITRDCARRLAKGAAG